MTSFSRIRPGTLFFVVTGVLIAFISFTQLSYAFPGIPDLTQRVIDKISDPLAKMSPLSPAPAEIAATADKFTPEYVKLLAS